MKHPYLKNCTYNKSLKLSNKRFIHNYNELAYEIENLEDHEFKNHVGKNYDDFADWIENCFDDDALADNLRKIKSKKKYANTIKKRIKQLENGKQKNNSAWVIVLILIILMIMLYASYDNADKKHMENKHVLMQKLSEAGLKSDVDAFKIKELETENKALKEKISALESDKTLLLVKPFENGPKDRIEEHNIRISGNNVNIYVEGPILAQMAGTGSMLPVLTIGSNVIEIIPSYTHDIQIGDIIAYELGDEIIIHRIFQIGTDEQGWYAITQGDHSTKPDPEKVRWDQVERVVVGIIY